MRKIDKMDFGTALILITLPFLVVGLGAIIWDYFGKKAEKKRKSNPDKA